MKEKNKSNGGNRHLRRLLCIFIPFVAVVSVGVIIFLNVYNSYIDDILYAERLNQMQEVTTQLFSGIDDVIDNQWKTAESQKNQAVQADFSDVDGLVSFLKTQAEANMFDAENTEIMAVDSEGRYYTQNGMRGGLVGLDYIMSSPERVSYVYNTVTTGVTEMVFLIRLDTPIPIKISDREVELIYYGISRNMSELTPYFKCSAYNDTNNVYVLDNDGLKLFSDTEEELLRGHNVYSVLKNMQYLHGTSFDDTEKSLAENGVAYSNAVLSGKEYYYALYQMENAEWTLLFMIPSENVAKNTVEIVNTTVHTILIFAVSMLVLSGLTIYGILRYQQKKAIEVEHRTVEKLAELNTELEAASRAKSDFLSNMSHDIRTPMNAIVGIANLMEHDAGDEDKIKLYIQKLQSSSRHLLGLISDILDMSKIEANEVSMNRESVSLAEQVGQIDSIVRSQTAENSQTFNISVHEISHEFLICDSVRLRQIFLNLLSNAVKYTPIGGEINFDLTELVCDEKDRAKFRFTVEDNGCGMESEFLEHIFEPFTRAESSVVNSVQGTGLGMAITKNIVDLMGGEIKVESEVGKGSRFEVVLTFDIDRTVSPKIDAKSLMLISDEEQLILNMTAALKETDVRFFAARTKNEAVGLLKNEKIEVILLAGHLRDNSLGETVRVLREQEKDIVLIFCCDYAQRDQVGDTLTRGGVDGLVTRPFFIANLVKAINNAKAEQSVALKDRKSTLNGKKFLCAEDNNLNAEILAALLDMQGATCEICADGTEIVKRFESVKPGEFDMILMDVQMPNMNGLDATRAIRAGKNPLGRTIPIIAMTANVFTEDVKDCLEAGMDEHISKPIDISALERTVRSFSTLPLGFQRKATIDE